MTLSTKGTWTSEQQEMSFFLLAAIDASRGQLDRVLEHIERSLVKNAHNIKARGLKAICSASWVAPGLLPGGWRRTWCWIPSISSPVLRRSFWDMRTARHYKRMRSFPEKFLMTARDYAAFGVYGEALDHCGNDYPCSCMTDADKLGRKEKAQMLLRSAEAAPSDYCFPNKLEDIAVLRFATENGCRARAPYYLGCFWYDQLQWREALTCWELAAENTPDFPTVWRNLP